MTQAGPGENLYGLRENASAHLYFPVQQLSGQNFQRAFAGQTSQSAEERTGAGVPDHVSRVGDVQNFKIVVDGVADDNFAV